MRCLPYTASIDAHYFLCQNSVSARLVPKMLALFLLAAHWWACVNFSIHRYSEAHAPQTWATVSGLSSYDPDTGLHDVCCYDIHTILYMLLVVFYLFQ
jgi:hypothetical protein